MKKYITFLLIVVFWSILISGISANATTLKWDTPTGDIVGYTAYYTDGTTDYNMNFPGEWFEVPNMEVFFNLKYGISYIFTLATYNNAGQSPISLPTDSFTRTSYVPPVDIVPVDVQQPPAQITNPLVDM